MKTTIFKLTNLVALLAAVAWLARAPDWEPFITSLCLFAALLGQEAWPHFRHVEKDKELLQKFLLEFPSNGTSMRFLKNQDIGAPFPQEDLDELYNFLDNWDDAEHEFRNKKLSHQRKRLYELIELFRNDLSPNIFSSGDRFLTMDLKDWEDRPDRLQIRDKLNDQATEIYKAHQELVRLGRKVT